MLLSIKKYFKSAVFVKNKGPNSYKIIGLKPSFVFFKYLNNWRENLPTAMLILESTFYKQYFLFVYLLVKATPNKRPSHSKIC